MANKSWGGAGAWAVDSELAETHMEQLDPQSRHQQQQPPSSIFAGEASFPSLGEAAHTKAPKKKKQTVSLAAFVAGGATFFSETKGLTTEEKMALPTGPRDRSGEDETLGGLGGGFRDYGGYRGEGRDRDYGRDRDAGYGGRRSDRENGFGKGGFGDRDVPEGPSRADVADDWGASKKTAPPSRNRFDDRDFPSRADDGGHWGSSKKFVSAPPAGDAPRRVSKYDFSSARSGAPYDSGSDSDSWAASKKAAPGGGYESFGHRDRDREGWNSTDAGGADSSTWGRKEADRGYEAPTERPRLKLQPRSQRSDTSPPLSSVEDTENEPSALELLSGQPSKPQKVNPFGAAKPREVVLEEKGMNWKKLDDEFQHKVSERGDGAEMALKEEIKLLQDSIKAAEADDSDDAGLAELKEKLVKKEGELEQLKATSSEKSGSWRGGDRAGNRKESNVWSRQPSNGDTRFSSEKRNSRW